MFIPPGYALQTTQRPGYWFQDSANPTVIEVINAMEKVFEVYKNLLQLQSKGKVDQIGLKIYQISIYLFSEYLLRMIPESFHTGTGGKLEISRVAMKIMDTLLKLQLIKQGQNGKRLQEYCDEFHRFRDQGACLWTIVCTLGPGSLIVCEQAINTALNIPTEMLSSVLGEILDDCPGVIAVCHEFDSVAIDIISGRVIVPQLLRSFIINRIDLLEGLLYGKDWKPEHILSDWRVACPEINSEKKMEEFFDTINTGMGELYHITAETSFYYQKSDSASESSGLSGKFSWAALPRELHDMRGICTHIDSESV